MPAPQELPEPIAQLAYLNAFEIYDRMFDESIARLIAVLDPPKARMLRWANSFVRYAKERPVPFIVTSLFLLISAFALSLGSRGDRSPHTQTTIGHVDAPPVPAAPSNQEAPDLKYADAVAVRIPSRIAKLPSVVDATRHVFLRDDFRKTAGPQHPCDVGFNGWRFDAARRQPRWL